MPNYLADQAEWIRRASRVVNNLLIGKTNNTGTVTFTVSATTTTITDSRIGFDSTILFMPTNATAAGEVGFYVSSQTQGSAVVTHAFDSRTRTFKFVVIG